MDKNRNVSVISYLPNILQEVEEIKALNSVENPILNQEWLLTFQQLDNQFVRTSDLIGIERYEKMLGIKPGADDDLETRMFRILTISQENAPYTFKVLNNIMNGLLGKGNFSISRNVATKEINFALDVTQLSKLEAASEMLERILPANMIYNVVQKFNTHMYVGGLTHADLTNYTHKEIREDDLTVGVELYSELENYTYNFLSSFNYNQIREGEI